MHTKHTHKSNFGSALTGEIERRLTADADGYIEYHDDPRYKELLEYELTDLVLKSEDSAVRNAALVEEMERAIHNWRNQ